MVIHFNKKNIVENMDKQRGSQKFVRTRVGGADKKKDGYKD